MEQQPHGKEVSEQQLPKQLINRKISELSDLQLRYTYSNASSTSEFSMYEPTSTEQFECKYVKDDQLYSQLLEKIEYVRTVVNIEHEDICLYVLQYYQWNQQKMANLYFSEDWGGVNSGKERYNSSHSHAAIIKDGDCQVCLNHTTLYSSGFCSHFYCRPCWTNYIKHELWNGRIFSSCMNQPPCPRAPILKGFVDAIAPELSELNRKKICISYAIQNKDICYCPNEKCPYFCIKPNMMEINTVTCPCGELYCYKCRKEPHFPVPCENVKRWYALLNSEQANSSWIKNNTRECPKCKQPIEKKVGCSHMKCLCLCEFCYECNRLWDEAHISRKTECPFRKDLMKREKDGDRIAELDAYLTQLMKQAERNRNLLMQCQSLIQDETLLSRVVQLKTDVISAWMTFKWTKILLCLDSKDEIQGQLEKQFIQSIKSVMEPIEIIIKNAKCLASKELHYYGEQVLQRKEILKKNVRTWLDAWEYVTA